MSLLEQTTTRKEPVEKVLELDTGNTNSKKYKIEAIWDNAVYARKLEGHLPGFYYLVATLKKKILENHFQPFST